MEFNAVFERAEGTEGFRGGDFIVIADVGGEVGCMYGGRSGIVGCWWGFHVQSERYDGLFELAIGGRSCLG